MALATLSIDLVAKLASLEQGLDKAYRLNERTAQQIEGRWKAMSVVASSLGAAIGGAFSAQAIVRFTTATIDALDALNDSADATGATIENLSALEDIARRNGGTLDDVTGILVKFNGALKEADGKNGVSQALKAIGLDAVELRKMDPAEALQKVALALAGFADDGNKARLVQELFGKSIREAAPFLNDLAEAGRLNATVTTEQAKAAEAFNKQTAALQTNISNLARTLTSEAIPALNSYLEKVLKLPKNLDIKYAEGSAFQSGEAYRKAVESVEMYQELLRKDPAQSATWNQKLEELRSKLPALAKEAAAASDKLKALLGPGDPIAGAGRGFVNPELVKPSVGQIGGKPAKTPIPGKDANTELMFSSAFPLSDVWAALEATDVAKIQRLNEQIAKLQGFVNAGTTDERFPQAIANLREQLAKLTDQTDPLGDFAKSLEGAFDQRLIDQIAALAEATPEGAAKRLREMIDAVKQLDAAGGGDRESNGAALKVLQQQLKDLETTGVDLGKTLEDALGTSLSASLKGNFESIGDYWENLIIDMVSKAAAADLQNLLLGSGKGGNLAQLGSSVLKLFGVPGFASGGDHEGGLRIVGERGPELEFTGPSRILNANQTRSALSGGRKGGDTYHIHVAAGVGRAEVYQAVQQGLQAAKADTRQLLRSAGSY